MRIVARGECYGPRRPRGVSCPPGHLLSQHSISHVFAFMVRGIRAFVCVWQLSQTWPDGVRVRVRMKGHANEDTHKTKRTMSIYIR